MATKKKAAVKKPTARKAPPVRQRVALKLLTQLPPLDERRRRVFRSAFSDAQCKAWGDSTKASAVLQEAERFVAELHLALKRGAPTGYSINRFVWLTHLVNDLEDCVAADSAQQHGGRTEPAGAIELADKVRKKLVNALMAASTGRPALRGAVTDRNEPGRAQHQLESTLTGLLQLAVRLRLSDDGETLADEVGLTETFLSSVSAVTDSLRLLNEATYDRASVGGRDSTTTNVIEGRVLREMGFAVKTFRAAQDSGESVATLKVGTHLARFLRAPEIDEADAPLPDSAPTPPQL